MEIKYKVEWEMNGSYGAISKKFDKYHSAEIFYNKKKCDCTTKSIKLVKCEVLECMIK